MSTNLRSAGSWDPETVFISPRGRLWPLARCEMRISKVHTAVSALVQGDVDIVISWAAVHTSLATFGGTPKNAGKVLDCSPLAARERAHRRADRKRSPSNKRGTLGEVFAVMEEQSESIATATSSPRRPSFIVLCEQERRRWDMR